MTKPDCFSTQRKDALEACDECSWRESCDSADDGICPHCSGSGEGQTDGSRCSWCKGRGIAAGAPDSPPDWVLDEERERRRGEY